MRRNRNWIGVLIVAAISAPAVAQDITSNLSGQWKLIETSGTTAVDSSSTANNGTYTNGVTLANSTPVPLSSAVAAGFDGTDDFVAIPNEALYDAVGATTIAVWIKVNAWTVADQAIITKGDTASSRLTRDGINNGVAFVCRGLTTIRVASTTSVNDGKWHHVAGVYTGSQLRIYIDGVLNNSVGSFGFISTNNFPVQIGSNAEVAGKNFNGWIYDVRFYARALSAVDISYLYLLGAPVGHWKLSETSGTTAADSSIYAANGAITGTANWSTDCGGTPVFNFDGSTNVISIPNATQLQPTSTLTIAAWVRGNTWGVADVVNAILRKGEANPNNYELSISDGRVELLLDGNDAAGFRGNTVLNTGQWYHVAATWDGSVVKIYVNGVLDNTPPSRTGAIATDTRPLYIGGRPGTDLFNGSLRDVRLYSRALSQAEIQKLAGLVGYWPFSEGVGTTAADTSGQANNATLSGGATWTTECAGNNNALQTNGISAMAQTTASFAPPSEGTVAFWMRGAGPLATRGRLMGVTGDWEIRQEPGGILSFDLGGSPYVGNEPFSTLTPVDKSGRWYHIAAVYSDVDNSYSVYVDGQLRTSGISPVDLVPQAAGVLSFGIRAGTSEYWLGALRDVRIYNRRLCPLEIAALYGLIGYWKLNETAGITASDSSGLGHNAAVSGTVAWTNAKINNGFQFNYANGSDYITLPNSSALDNVQEANYTLAAWFKPLSTPPGTGSANNANYAILLKAGYHCGLSYSNAQQFEFGHYLTGNVWKGTGTWSDTYPPGVFHHVVAAVNRTAGTISLYVDGLLKGTDSFSANTVAREFGTMPWQIGIADPTYSSWGWAAHAVADDVRIYNRCLCPAEVQDVYQSGNPFGGVKITKWVELQ